MPFKDDLDSTRRELKHRIEKFDHDSVKKEFLLRTEPFVPDRIEAELRHIREQQWWVISLILAGLFMLIFMVAGMLVEAWRFNATMYKEFKLTKIHKDIIGSTKEQKPTTTAIKSLEKKIEELQFHIGVTKAITDVTNGQKLLTKSVEDLQEELKELKVLHQIEKNTTDIIDSLNVLINSFQSLKQEVHKLTTSSQDDTGPNMIDKPKITDNPSQYIKEESESILQNIEHLKQRIQRLEELKKRLNMNRRSSITN